MEFLFSSPIKSLHVKFIILLDGLTEDLGRLHLSQFIIWIDILISTPYVHYMPFSQASRHGSDNSDNKTSCQLELPHEMVLWSRFFDFFPEILFVYLFYLKLNLICNAGAGYTLRHPYETKVERRLVSIDNAVGTGLVGEVIGGMHIVNSKENK